MGFRDGALGNVVGHVARGWRGGDACSVGVRLIASRNGVRESGGEERESEQKRRVHDDARGAGRVEKKVLV